MKSLVSNHFYPVNSMNEISETETNKYLIQTRSQAKSSGIKILEIHGINKGINPHIKPGRQRPLPTLPMHSIPPTTLVQPVDNGPPTHPIPKPRIGQGRAGLKKKLGQTSLCHNLNRRLLNQYKHLLKRKHCHCLSLQSNHKRMCNSSIICPYH